MFGRKKSLSNTFKSSTKDLPVAIPSPPRVQNTSFQAPEVQQAPKPAPAPAPVIKRVEPKPAPPTGPQSIVPPGTKRMLVVGKYVVMTADVENCDAVIVQGNLDGVIKAKYIVIMKGGCMRGTLECKEADVAGSFEGVEFTAHHRLSLSSTARVGGRMTYNRLAVQDGAIITGELVYKPATKENPPPKAVAPTADDDTSSVRSDELDSVLSGEGEMERGGRGSGGAGRSSEAGGRSTEGGKATGEWRNPRGDGRGGRNHGYSGEPY